MPRNDGTLTQFKIIVNDSGSNDKTHEILLNLQAILPRLEIVSDTAKAHGAKLIALYKKAVADDAEWIFQTDSDNQTNPLEFAPFWQLRGEFDAILGWRKVRGDGAWRKFIERVVCLLLFIFFGVKIKDANAPFRLMKTRLIAKYIEHFEPNFNIPNIVLTAFFAKNKEKITFREITFKSRTAGKNSINFKRIFKIGLKALVDFARFKKVIKNAK